MIFLPLEQFEELAQSKMCAQILCEKQSTRAPSVPFWMYQGYPHIIVSAMYGPLTGDHDGPQITLCRLVSETVFNGEKILTYRELRKSWDSQERPRGDFHGLVVSIDRKPFVVSKQLTAYAGLPSTPALSDQEAMIFHENYKNSGWRALRHAELLEIIHVSGHPVLIYDMEYFTQRKRVGSLIWRKPKDGLAENMVNLQCLENIEKTAPKQSLGFQESLF